jgi:hypothetical protein
MMSAPSTRNSITFRYVPALVGVAVSMLLAFAPEAVAEGLASDEVKRKPVQYQAGSNCSGAQHFCNISFGNTPSKNRKRVEIAGISCVARIYSGDIYRISIQGGTTLQAYEELEPVHTGTHNDNEYFVARSTMRYFAPVGDEMKAYVNATGDIAQFFCTLNGTLVTYKKA